MQVPEQGQLVQVRNRHFIVDDVFPHRDGGSSLNRVVLECLDDDAVGSRLEVVWEREVNAQVFDTSQIPSPAGGGWDTTQRFDAFTSAVRWSVSSLVEPPTLQAAFHGAIDLDEYQLVPVVRALQMTRVNLLLADDVGLGKTIEAGLVLQELIARRRARRVLIVCPASLQQQWRDEMESKFHLPFQIVDATAIQGLRREYGVHVNPWSSFPRLITSMDFLKQATRLQDFRNSLVDKQKASILRDWDLLIVDEVHNCAPSGRQRYVRDSDRTRMLRDIAPHFEHKLFLTATPHNGYTESFTALLEMLDPLRFNRGPVIDVAARDTVMIRRLKDQIRLAFGQREFAERHVDDPISVTLSGPEAQMAQDLNTYCKSRLDRAQGNDLFPVKFALTLLKKRFLSSPHAFWNSLQTHMKVAEQDQKNPDVPLVERLSERSRDDWDDDDEKARHEETALQEASQFFASLVPDERQLLRRLSESADQVSNKPDTKARELLRWIETNLRPGGEWNNERLIVFTEYRDTLEYLRQIMGEQGWGDQLMVLRGGMNLADRERVKSAFQSASSPENPVRILLGTDAASEGLNLQNHCRLLVHYEIPWNPNRMEQRNGRIDRHGQPASDVYCRHFTYTNNEDQRFLEVVVEKVRTQRADLGAVGDVIAAQVEEAILGLRTVIEDPVDRRRRQEDDLRSQVRLEQDVRDVQNGLLEARAELRLYPDVMAQMVDQALRLHGHSGLEPIEHGDLGGSAWDLRNLPAAWHDCRRYLTDQRGARLHVVFDPEVARDRHDVALVHLGHPLMKRAMSVFRSSLWEQTGGTRLHRCSYRILPDRDLPQPAVVLFGRVVALGGAGEKLHESIITLGSWIKDARLDALPDSLLHQLLRHDSVHPPIPVSLADALRTRFPAHRALLEKSLAELEASETVRVKAALAEKGKQVEKEIRDLVAERIREITKRLTDAQKESERAQLRLLDLEEKTQYDLDLHWLERRRDTLQQDRETQPGNARERFTLKSLRIFPLGLLYLLPDSLLAEDGGR
ncbi:MAG TPA: DISARM system SNF2-like helicase DrmD [Armatimonadota bacterium]|jgi:hypothetical protein